MHQRSLGRRPRRQPAVARGRRLRRAAAQWRPVRPDPAAVMKRTPQRFRRTYANVVGVIAIVLALGGISYAATALPGKSVGKKQLTRNSVVGSKVKEGSLLAKDV